MDIEILFRRVERLELEMGKMVARQRNVNTISTDAGMLYAAEKGTFISEAEAIKIICRSKSWLKKQRLGYTTKGVMVKPTLERYVDWVMINGRTPQYRAGAIWNLKRKLQN